MISLGKASIVISACNEGENLIDMVHYLLENTGPLDFEVVVVDDGSTDGSGDRLQQRFETHPQIILHRTPGLGVAGGRNAGASLATGDVLIFLDGHCYLPPDWLPPLITALQQPDIGLVGPAITDLSKGGGAKAAAVTWTDATLQPKWIGLQGDQVHPVPLLPGGAMATRRDVFYAVGQFDDGMVKWGSESEELSLRYWLMGYQVVAQPATLVYHLFRSASPYPVDVSHVLYNRLRLAILHFNPKRLMRIGKQLKTLPSFSQVKHRLQESDVLTRREKFQEKRHHDDDWFCQTFNCPL